jgi:S-adenosylmethionine:tRNA ribosyltransferase-isomerase
LLRVDDYDYRLPEGRIARHPPASRDGGRLFVVGPPEQHLNFTALAAVLRAGDLLVVNDTRVLKARVQTVRGSGGGVEVFFLETSRGHSAVALCRPARRLKVGEALRVPGQGTVQLQERLDRGRWRVHCHPSAEELMDAVGQVPLPLYLGRDAVEEDSERYQTVFAANPGAVAAPTAGLHFSARLLADLERAGIVVAAVTLHVGAGTFRPVDPDDVIRGRLHREAYEVPAATVAAVAACRKRGGRVIAIGTTTARALESATAEDGRGVPCLGPSETELFIQPGYTFRCVDALVTNFHLPRSSLLMLVSAIVGREYLLSAYRTAIARGYRFYSYGDAMFLEVRR